MLWLFYLASYFIGLDICKGSLLHDPYVGDELSIYFISLELQFAAASAFGVSLGLMGVASLLRSIKLRRLAVFVLLGFSVVGVLIPWAQLFYLGRFPQLDSVLFYAASPWHLFEHAMLFSPKGTVAVLTLCGFISVVLYRIMDTALNACSISVKYVFSLLVCMGLILTQLLWSPSVVLSVRDSEEGQLRLPGASENRVTTIGDYFESILLFRTGPMSSVCLPYIRAKSYFEGFKDSGVEVVYVPRMSAEAYGDAVNRSVLDSRPNVIVILIESLRLDQLKERERGIAVMPNLAALADANTLFTRHYASASHSNYADISVLSGVYPFWGFNTHVYPESAPYPRPRIYDLLGATGYRSAVISSQNERWGGMLNYLQSPHLDFLYHAGDQSPGETLLGHRLSKIGGKGKDVETLALAAHWIAQQTEPVFAYINLQTTHYPYYYPSDKERIFGQHMDVSDLNFLHLPEDKIEPVMNLYQDSLYHADALLGDFFDRLKEQGLWDETIIVIAGDTAQAFGEHQFTGHASRLYDEVLRTPLIVRIPGREPQESDQLTQHVDIPSLILDALNLPSFPGFQGISPLDDVERSWAPLVCQSPALKQLAIVTPESKLLYELDTRAYEWYDLDRDPAEQFNRYAEMQDAVELSRLRRLLHAWGAEQVRYYQNASLYQRSFAPQYFLKEDSVAPSQSGPIIGE